MTVFTAGTDFLEWRVQTETVRLTAWGANSLRVVSRPNGELNLASPALLGPTQAATVTIEATRATIQNGSLTAVVDLTHNGGGQLSFYDDQGKLLLKEADDGGALMHRARDFQPLGGGDWRLKATFQSARDERLYGMGQYQQDFFDLKGCNLELAQRNSQVTIPFYLSDQGYGFFWDNPAVGSVSFGRNTTEWRADSTAQLDYWVTAGATPEQIVTQFTAVVGRAPEMPEYGLGFWQCKLRYATQAEVLAVAREYHRRRVPIDVLVIDYYHWPRCGDYRFDPDAFPDPAAMTAELHEYGIKLMVSVWPQIDVRSENYAEMRQNGLLVQTTRGPDVQMIFHGNNVFYDPTNPRARRYVWDKVKRNYLDQGVDLFWLDEAEPEFGTYDAALYRYHEGAVLQVGNLFPREYVRGFAEGQTALAAQGDTATASDAAVGQLADASAVPTATQSVSHQAAVTQVSATPAAETPAAAPQPALRPAVNLVRCAWAGSQRYGALVWSGDVHSTWQDLRNQMVAGLQMGIAGIPWWTTDIGGFHGGQAASPAFQELLIRWFQYGAFCPVMRIHRARQPFSKVYKASGEETEGEGAANEIWSFGEANYAIMKKFILIREKLRPYSRQVMHEAHTQGLPVIRPLFMAFPADAAAWDVADEYLYGPDILVAPVTTPGSTRRAVYLPAGATWTDARDGRQYAGGQTITAQAPLETLPVFLRDGQPTVLQGEL
ncbi:glycoside hydrolase family 31 protein [Lacticaseibacillus suihuaensis]